MTAVRHTSQLQNDLQCVTVLTSLITEFNQHFQVFTAIKDINLCAKHFSVDLEYRRPYSWSSSHQSPTWVWKSPDFSRWGSMPNKCFLKFIWIYLDIWANSFSNDTKQEQTEVHHNWQPPLWCALHLQDKTYTWPDSSTFSPRPSINIPVRSDYYWGFQFIGDEILLLQIEVYNLKVKFLPSLDTDVT